MKLGIVLLLIGIFCLPVSAQMKARLTPSGVLLIVAPPSTPANAPLLSMRVYRSQALGLEKPITSSISLSNLTCPAKAPSGDQCFTDTTIVFGVVYYYQVTYSNANGEGLRSNELQVATSVANPPAPTNASATFVTDPAMIIQWTPPVGFTLFNVYRDISGTSNYSKINSSPISCTQSVCTYYDNTIKPATFYNYMVVTYSPGVGESGDSNKIFAPFSQ